MQEKKIKRQRMQYNNFYQKILEYSLLLSTKKRYTVYEMRKKINARINKNAKDINEEEKAQIVSQVCNRLIELNYLNDEKYISDYISEKSKLNPKGKFYFTGELIRKGLDKEKISKYFDENDFEELPLAKRALDKKKRLWKDLPFLKIRNKAFNYLSGRGFSAETIYKVMDIYYSNHERESY